MPRPSEPPPLTFFERRRPHAGTERLALRLGGLEIGIQYLSDELAETLRARYAPYVADWVEQGRALVVDFHLDPGVDYYIDPPENPELNPVRIRAEAERVRYLGYRVAGWFQADGGRGEILLAEGDYEPADRALENFVRAAVAWQAASRGGALVHAASAVHRGGGYLFFGPSGAGKSTLSEANRRARVVSDDLSLVLPGDDGALELVGSPFRGTYEGGEPVEGRFPLRAGFRLVQADAAGVVEVPRPRVMGELVGNLPFVAEEFRSRPDLFRRVTEAFDPIPLRHLEFAKDETYWDAIEAAGL